MVWASYSQFQQAVRTMKNQFELDSASFNDKENQFWASFTASFNEKEKWFELVTASFKKQWEPGRTSLS